MQLSRIDTYMMSIAFLTASMSKAKRLQVGAVFARDNRPLCTGWNGVLEGYPTTLVRNLFLRKTALLTKQNPQLSMQR